LRPNESIALRPKDALEWAEVRRLLSRSIQDQQLMFQKKGFDNDCNEVYRLDLHLVCTDQRYVLNPKMRFAFSLITLRATLSQDFCDQP
jgi:hypothetical protein